jgi:hypothetical protein
LGYLAADAETLALGITVVLMVAAIAVGIAAPVLLFVRPNLQRTTTFPQGRE